MFESLRAAFREAVKNFRDELHRDEVPEAVDRLLREMKREATDARVRLRDLEDGISRARAEAARELEEATTCRRRERMARSIGDEETAGIAAEYGARHERRRQVLEQKAEALERELELRRAEVDEMIEKIREAERGRDALTAAAGRAQARESVRAGDDLYDELDRMAEQIGDREGRTDAAGDLLDELDRELGLESKERPPPGADLDARLAELKRRMGRG